VPEHHPSRRRLLGYLLGAAVGATGLLPGCTSVPEAGQEPGAAPQPTPGTGAPVPSPPATISAASPELRLAERVVAEKRSLLARYAATRRAHPALAGRLDPLAAEHAAHLDALAAVVEGEAPATTPNPAATPAPAPSLPAVPARPDRALAALAAREAELARQRLLDVDAVAPDLARLLASIGGAEAAHAALMEAGA
jgi:hypothetical protein